MGHDRARVLLVGLGPTTGAALTALLTRFEVVGLVRDVVDPVAGLAGDHDVPVSLDGDPRGIAHLVERLAPDCVVVSSYDRILPADLLARCPFVNVHYAPLPQYRGRANVNWAIINGEDMAAVTVHTMAPELDAGGILGQERVAITPRDTVTTLYERLNEVLCGLLPAAVSRRLSGDQGDPQDERLATYGCTRVPDDGLIDWRQGTLTIDRLVRALTDPYPGAFTFLRLHRVWILDAEPSPTRSTYVGRVPGRVVGRSAGEGWADVLTGDGTLRVHRVRQDGTELPAAAVLKGTRVTLGVRETELVERISELERRLRGAEGHAG
jgi:methionyl-tRNA formyltransferase